MWRIQAQSLYVRIWTKLYAFIHHFNYLNFGFQFECFCNVTYLLYHHDNCICLFIDKQKHKMNEDEVNMNNSMKCYISEF